MKDLKFFLVFVFAVVMLVSAVPAKEAKAASDYNLAEALEICGITWDTSNSAVDDFVCGGYEETAKYFMIFRKSSGDYIIVFFDSLNFTFNSITYSRPSSESFGAYDSSNTVRYECCSIASASMEFTFQGVLTRLISSGGSYFVSSSGDVTFEYANFDFSIGFYAISKTPYHEQFSESYTHVHSFASRERAATCIEDGLSFDRCSCGETQNEIIIPALGHGELNYNVTQEPSLESEGTYTRTCSVCGEVVESGVISALATPTPMPTFTPTPTLEPSPELVSQTADFFLLYVMVMTLFQTFPLNLFVVACLLCVAVILFYWSYKKVKGGK